MAGLGPHGSATGECGVSAFVMQPEPPFLVSVVWPKIARDRVDDPKCTRMQALAEKQTE